MRLSRSTFVLACALVAAVSATTADSTTTLRLQMRPSGHFAVENLAGTMTIVPGSSDQVVAVATIHAESNDVLRKISFEQVSGENGVPTMRVIYPIEEYGTFRYPTGGSKFFGMFGGGSNTNTKYAGERVRVSDTTGVLLYADVEIQLPSGADAQFRNVVGKMTAEKVSGKLAFDTGSGEIMMTGLSGSISADTGSGNIIAEDIDGDFSGDTGSGDITLAKFEGEGIDCDTGSGDIRIDASKANRIMTDTGSGDIRVEAETVEFQADTGSGDIDLVSDARIERVDADTGSGDVTLVLGPEASFEAHASIGSGDIVSRYPDAQAIVQKREVVGYRRGDGRTRIDVDTGSGDVVLRPTE